MKFKVFVYSAAIILSISSCKPENILQVAPGAEIVTSCKAVHDSSGSYSSIEKSAIDVIYSLSGTGNYNDSIMVFDVTVLNPTEQAWQGIVKFELRVKSRQPWFFMPGFMYGDNKSPMDDDYMQKLWPRLEKGDEEIPYAPYFRVRSDRLSYPLSAVYSNNHVYAIAGSPYLITNGDSTVCWYPGKEGAFVQFNGMGCEIDSAEASVCYTLGYENAPWLYVGGKINKPATDIQKGSVSIGPGESLKLRLFVYSFEAEDRRGLNDVVKHQFALFHEEPRKVVSPEQAMKDLTEALYNDAYDKKARNYATVTRLVDGEVVRDRASFSIGWTGGMVVAAPLLLAAIRLDREDMREQALECIQDIVDNSLNEKSGLPYDAKVDEQWTTNGWWEHYLWKPLEGISAHSSYLSGQALFYILKAYEIEKEFRNTEHKDWLDFVIKVSDRIEKTKNQEHEYPYRWSPETGEAIDYDAMGGAWCLATRAYLASILDDSTMLLQSEQSIDHYWNKFVKQMNCYGTPHDVWMATEEEGVLAFVKAATILHQYTSNGKYLEYLRDGIDYEFTWKYCYNTVVLVPPLSKINWSSSGASGTSVANPHVHPMGNLIVDDVFYYANQTNDNYYRQRALDMVFWGLQSYNHVEGELDFGKKGWMSERHCPHQGLLLEKYPDGEPASVWFVYHSWASGCVLEGIAGTYWNEQSIN
jgi:hypothetical protein